MKLAPSLIVATLALTACKKGNQDEPAPAPGSGAAAGSGVAAAGSSATGTITVGGFATPESVLHDTDSDVYLVSNINGEPAGVDDNGFISKLAPDGTVIALRWIDGASPDVVLDAPKGTTISGGTLWVADITVVRKFDASTGAPTGTIALEGASFVNDVVADGAGGVYVTDSGVDAKFQPTGSDAVYRIGKDDKVTTVMKAKALGNPNGVWADGDVMWVVNFAGEIYKLAGGKQEPLPKLPKGMLDGVVGTEGGELLVSSWDGSAVYRARPGGEWKEAVGGIAAPADIGWDSKRKAVLIPKFMANEVVIQTLP